MNLRTIRLRARPPLCALFLPLLLLLGLAGAGPVSAATRCVDDEPDAAAAANPASAAKAAPADALPPRQALRNLVRDAVQRSQGIGAARMLAEAAAADVEEQRAAALPQATFTAGAGPVLAMAENTANVSGGQVHANINMGALLFDGGHNDALTGWRRQLAEAARFGQISAEEQIGLQTVSLTLERGRYVYQAKVYQQYARNVACLVDALEQIVSVDKGRASELVQAKKTLQQVQLSQADTASQLRLVEIRLRRFLGDELPDTNGLTAVLMATPPIDEVQADALRASDLAQLSAQVDAATDYARAVSASGKPQVSWQISGSKAVGVGNSTNVLAGINVTVPLFNPGLRHSVDAAHKRAEAARLQRADALEARRSRIAEVHEQAVSAFDRARRVAAVVNNSDQVRVATIEQWQRLGRRSLFDVMAAEGDHYSLRIAYVNALYDGEQSNALLRSLGLGLALWLE